MKNLFVGGSSEIAIMIAKKLRYTDNIGRKKLNFFKSNYTLKSYTKKNLISVFKKIKKKI